MKKIISIVLALVIIFLTWALIQSIKEPIAFQKVKKERKDAVVAHLEKVRKAQEAYRDITGKFAGNFDSLKHVLTTDSFTIENIVGDPDDPTGQAFTRTLIKKPAIDSILKLGIELEGLEKVPFGDGKTFSIEADTMTYQSTLVNVVEVGTRWKDFMGEYASKKYSKYDNSYDPDKRMKFGNMNAPNLSGNWDR
ncbi:MAG: hypothetical protein HKO66_14830 [Saprospiraceae bacterium]|nr:hypothetical protein [Bacteroidia bacterium]NNE16382.1 hypothetical protein [Saprospiraceae bacterium]NNL93514.1 hypothetical protein [Saprospiraceae bacterium]